MSEKTGSRIALYLSLLSWVALIGLAVCGYRFYQQWMLLQVQSQSDTTSVSTLLEEGKKALDEMQAVKQQNTALQAQLEQSQKQLVTLRGQKDWVLSEAHYLLFMANQRLQLAQDIPSATLQLNAALERILSLGDPSLIHVQAALRKDIAKLQSAPYTDKRKIWSELEALNSEFIPLSYKTLAQDTPEEKALAEQNLPVWRKALWQSWLELKSLIRVTREAENSISPALSTQEKAQVMRTLQLAVEQAQWAVLQGDTQIYTQSLATIQKNLQDFFNADKNQQALLAHIQQLEKTTLQVPPVDITESLQALSVAMHGERT